MLCCTTITFISASLEDRGKEPVDPELRKLNKGMMGLSRQYCILQAAPGRNAALRNLAFYGRQLFTGSQTQMPAEVKSGEGVEPINTLPPLFPSDEQGRQRMFWSP